MKKIYILLIFLFPIIHFAQSDLPPPGLEDPQPAASIDQIQYVLFFTAIVIGGFYTYRKSKKPAPQKKTKHKINLSKTSLR